MDIQEQAGDTNLPGASFHSTSEDACELPKMADQRCGSGKQLNTQAVPTID
jgi:hypothetical protein